MITIDFYKDKKYWDKYYSQSVAVETPSEFARSIMHYTKIGDTIVDLGCGNGRDSIYFLANGLSPISVDGSETAIEKLTHVYNKENIEFICGNFIDSPLVYKKQYDCFYSRFSLHSIDEESQHILFKNIYKHLKREGYLFIEVRSIYDDIYGCGEQVERNAFIYNDHYRRFLVIEELEDELQKLGFSIVLSEQDKGFAKFKDADPIVIRMIVQKV